MYPSLLPNNPYPSLSHFWLGMLGTIISLWTSLVAFEALKGKETPKRQASRGRAANKKRRVA